MNKKSDDPKVYTMANVTFESRFVPSDPTPVEVSPEVEEKVGQLLRITFRVSEARIFGLVHPPLDVMTDGEVASLLYDLGFRIPSIE